MSGFKSFTHLSTGGPVMALQWDGNPKTLRGVQPPNLYTFYISGNAERTLVLLHDGGVSGDLQVPMGGWLVLVPPEDDDASAQPMVFNRNAFLTTFVNAVTPVHDGDGGDVGIDIVVAAVGDVVLYHPRPSEAAGTGGAPHAALVTRLHPDGALSLVVFPPLRPSYTMVSQTYGSGIGQWNRHDDR